MYPQSEPENLTNLCQVTKDQKSLGFYSVLEFHKWKEATDGSHTWKVKYYKGQFCFQPVVD